MGAEQGYVYIILGGEQYDASLRMIRDSYYLRAGVVAFFLAIAATLIVGLAPVLSPHAPAQAPSSDAVRGFEKGDLARRVGRSQGTDELGRSGGASTRWPPRSRRTWRSSAWPSGCGAT